VNYEKINGCVYETEIGMIPPGRLVKIILQSADKTPFEGKVTVYQ